MRRSHTLRAILVVLLGLTGCHHPSITAVSLNPTICTGGCTPFFHHHPKEPQGIPFYLPKPLLIVAKNFRNIEESRVGLTDSAPIPNYFDDQAKYADLNARTNFVMPDSASGNVTSTNTTTNTTTFPANAENLASVAEARVYSENGAPVSPGAAPSDGLTPATFYTYHIVFVPDLTQKYGLKIKGGVGEIRAAMNLVNGWQFTGLGPYYMKDSSSAQNTLAAGITANLAGSGVANVMRAAASLRPGVAPGGGGQRQSGVPQAPITVDDVEKVKALTNAMKELNPKFIPIPAYAEISIYEPYLTPDGMMEWKPILERSYTRDVLTTDSAPHEVINMLRQATGLAVTPETAPVPSDGRSPFAPAPSIGIQPGSPTPPVPAPGSIPLDIPVGAVKPPRLDQALIRTQGTTAPPPQKPASATEILGDVDPKSKVTMRLSRAPGSGAISDQFTNSPNPTLEVKGLPANSNIHLFRDNQPLFQARTGANDRGILLTDNQGGPVTPGNHEYVVALVDAAGQVTPVSKLRVQVRQPPVVEEAIAPQTTVSQQTPGIDPALIRQMFAQVGALPPEAASAPSAATPPHSGNQVILNQNFGKAGHRAPQDPSKKHFGFLHKKEKGRPEIRTIALDGPPGPPEAENRFAPQPAIQGQTNPQQNAPIQNTGLIDNSGLPQVPLNQEVPIKGTGTP